MQSFLLPRTAALTACLCIGAAPLIVAAPAHAADTPGPATCYVADENENILEPRREYVPNDGTGEVPVRPSPVVSGQYTLEISAPALNFDPDQPDIHFVCEVFYSPLGSVRLVDADGTVLATQRYNNDQHNPSRAAATPLPALPAGYEIVPGQTVFGYDPVAGTVDPNNPANARAVGANTDIAIRKVTNNPAPTRPHALFARDTRPHALGDCDARAFRARDACEADACSEARTHGHGRGTLRRCGGPPRPHRRWRHRPAQAS